MAKKHIILSSLFLLLLGFFFLLEIFLPDLVAGKIKTEIEDRFRGEIVVNKVEVNSKPALKLLLGRADSITFEAEGLALGKLEAERLELVLEEVEIEFLQSGTKNISVLDQAKNVAGSMVITEAALNSFIIENNLIPLKNPILDLKEGNLILKGNTDILNKTFQVQVLGSFKVTNGNTLVFLPADLAVAGLNLPEFLKEGLLKQIAFQMTLENIPLDLKLSKLQLHEDRAQVTIEK